AGGAIVLVASALDMLDGAVARATGRASKFGALYDSVLDRASEAVVLFGIAAYALDRGSREQVLLAFAAVVGSLLVSYVRARAEGLGVALTDGLFRRQERVVLTAAGLILGLLRPALWILAVLSLLTALQRLILAARAVRAVDRTERSARD
ncbi:MAG: CDP-alcohol phosphatidyltransferase family protein, partial [Chloroflexi bacterium]|nr:CDP-alcohol phosphatidyltransferase family protein [Chloroflexota bacterium]MQC28023.1 CDP-alcohol phosphatidyltransferase family protein [Chloroflexota bacterium]